MLQAVAIDPIGCRANSTIKEDGLKDDRQQQSSHNSPGRYCYDLQVCCEGTLLTRAKSAQRRLLGAQDTYLSGARALQYDQGPNIEQPLQLLLLSLTARVCQVHGCPTRLR